MIPIFRAKNEDSVWVEGSLVRNMTNTMIREIVMIPPTYQCPGGDSRIIDHIVVEKTVGMFTGLYDKTKLEELTDEERSILFPWIIGEWKGVPIFEGDIVQFDSGKTGGGTVCEVAWDKKYARFALNYKGTFHQSNFLCFRNDWFKVIGNIHDE